ncbi:hypothetical protein ACLJJ6_00880 [Pediococcus siamensis]|uniref:hypothetical protein n=1 Tax=Pediococcus siamensis TaxID=381829 RepID=UPI0039A19295
MLLTNQDVSVLEVQILGVYHSKIEVKTISGEYLFAYPTQTQKTDPLFWQSLKDIIKAKLWLPINKKMHHLIDSDWLLPSNA